MAESGSAELLNEALFPGNTAAYEELIKFMSVGDVIGFTGAGASTPKYPTWGRLLSNLIEEAKSSGKIQNVAEYEAEISKDPLELASTLEEIFTKRIFRAKLGNIFNNLDGTATECQHSIAKLKLQGLVTLNYDSGHEAAFSRLGLVPNSGRSQDEATLTRWLQGDIFEGSRIPILHLHGETSDPDHMIFTSDDYDRFYATPLPTSLISQLWRSSRLLVIGFGFSDPFLTRLAEGVLRNLQSDVRHFALIGKSASSPVSALQKQVFAKKYRLTPIYYQVRLVTDESGKVSEDHSDLNKILMSLPQERSSLLSPPPSVVGQNTVGSTDQTIDVRKEFERDLFISPLGGVLYVEPRLSLRTTASEFVGVDKEETISVKELANDASSYIITARPEYGATTLGRTISLEFAEAIEKVVFSDAALLPNYKRKLVDEFARQGVSAEKSGILILDNFDFQRDERLLKEAIGTNLFKRVIVLAKASFFDASSSIPSDQFAIPFKLVSLAQMHRGDVRTLASQFYDTNDVDTVSATVDKVYRDFIDLCIPITPSNVIMYLTILYKEGSFNPINKVQIVGRYLGELFWRPSDAFREAFSAKNKMDVVSAFTFKMFQEKKTYFTETDWLLFCRDHMTTNLIHFDERGLLSELLASRILMKFGQLVAFKYRFFHLFFLGSYVANRPATMAQLISSSGYLEHEGLVEVISEIASDNRPLVLDIVEKLEQALHEFGERYVPESFDPFAELTWPSDDKEEENLWKPLTKLVERGPRNAIEIDEIKRSIIGEKRADNQQIVVQKFDRLERRLVVLHEAAVGSLANSDSLDGDMKLRATLAVLKAFFRIYQVGLILSPALVMKRYFLWHGILYVNAIPMDGFDEPRKVGMIMSAMRQTVVRKAAERMGSRKLGEVFKVLARDSEVSGYLNQLNFSCLLRAKPKDWLKAASDIVANTGSREFYLRAMLLATFEQYSLEVNTGQDRSELKSLIATIQIKRKLGKDRPGVDTVAKVVAQLEKQAYFEKAATSGSPENKITDKL